MKLWLDSRFAREVATSTWEFDLPGDALQFEDEGARFWLASWVGVVSLDTIDASNNVFYVVELGTPREVAIPNGVYNIDTLAVAMTTALNGVGKHGGMGTYSVTKTTSTPGATASAAYRFLSVACDAGAFLLPNTDGQILTHFGVRDPPSFQKVVAFPEGHISATSFLSDIVDTRRAHVLVVHSNISDNKNLGPQGERSILAQIPVTVGYGELLAWSHAGASFESQRLGGKSIQCIRIEIRDARGALLPWTGGAWSACLIIDDS